MKIFNASDVEDRELQRRVASLHLFREIRENDEEQYQRLLEHSRVMFFEPGDVVLSPGGLDRWLYFVVRGELEVLSRDESIPLTELYAGEIFGDIGQLTRKPRGNFVRVPQKGRTTIVLAVDFEQLGDLDYHQDIHIATKLYLYKQLVHVLRWRNDCYRQKFPDSELANRPYNNTPVMGREGSIEQLHGLAAQAEKLAERLIYLNYELGALKPQDKPLELALE
ncbi:cyclic nucleotide-binding domain-containing protein [bacterium SCSIO 12696]|nr:cyclic nucleotide-binding domain-containing protein [bacterium SCSIO 12696]